MHRMALLALRVLLLVSRTQSKYFDKSPLRYIKLLKDGDVLNLDNRCSFLAFFSQ